MRYLSICLLLLGASPLGAMDAWRWLDKDGIVHYSDQPTPGAEKVQIKPAPKPGSVAPAKTSRSRDTDAARQEPFRYSSCYFASPSEEQQFNHADQVTASLQLTPALRMGDRIEVTLNGQIVREWPEGQMSFRFSEMARGSYALAARVIDAKGLPLCTVSGVSFNVRQPSLLSPGRAKAPKS